MNEKKKTEIRFRIQRQSYFNLESLPKNQEYFHIYLDRNILKYDCKVNG